MTYLSFGFELCRLGLGALCSPCLVSTEFSCPEPSVRSTVIRFKTLLKPTAPTCRRSSWVLARRTFDVELLLTLSSFQSPPFSTLSHSTTDSASVYLCVP